MNSLAQKLVVSVVLFFLVAFGFIKMRQLAAVEAENIRLTEVNATLDSTAQHWQLRFAAADTVLERQLQTIDSLSQRTGPIRWRTRTVTVIEPGTTDTITIIDSMASVQVDSAVHFIPVAVALEIEECRSFIQTCDDFKHIADSTITWQATHIDTLQAQITNLSQTISPTSLALFGLSLPLPSVNLGYGVVYSLNECNDGDLTISPDGNSGTIDKECSRFHHGPVIGFTWEVWSP